MPSQALPRGPILGWSSFKIVDAPGISCVEDLKYTAFTTSGRAAIYQALLQLKLPPASTVLVPSYHCPTMVAPVLLANLNVAYFGLQADGLPKLDTIDAATASKTKVMLVSHYFGLARSLADVRRWCDERCITLIEDCAHCYFGNAGERPVGTWGDYSTASLSKFLPVPEGGLLGSAHRPIAKLQLTTPSIKAQLKGWVDIVELATNHRRLAGLNGILSTLFRLKNSRARHGFSDGNAAQDVITNEPGSTTESMIRDCDMTRKTQAPLNATMVIKTLLPRGQLIVRRQQNYACYAKHFDNIQGARPLFPLNATSASEIAPYVFPLWVDDADRVYQALRIQSLPVFRWDRIWPDTPELSGDVAPLWSRHVLQLLCHQDLSEPDIERTAKTILSLLSNNTY